MTTRTRSTPRSLRMLSLEIAARSSVQLVTSMIRRLTPSLVDSVLHHFTETVEAAVTSGAVERWIQSFADELRVLAQDERWVRRMHARFSHGLAEDLLTSEKDARIVEIVNASRALSRTYRVGGLYLITLPHRPKDHAPSAVLVEAYRREMRAAAAVKAMASARGEARARAALEAARFVVESSYRSFLEILVRLKRLEKANFNLDLFQSDVGPLADEAFSRFPSCVDRELIRIRNADAHVHYEYVPKTDTIRWSNFKRRDGTVEAGVDISVDDLVARVEDAYALAAGAVFTIRRDLTYAMFREARLDDLMVDVLRRWTRGESDWEDHARMAGKAYMRVLLPHLANDDAKLEAALDVAEPAVE